MEELMSIEDTKKTHIMRSLSKLKVISSMSSSRRWPRSLRPSRFKPEPYARATLICAILTFATAVFVAVLLGWVVWNKDVHSSIMLRNLSYPPTNTTNSLYVYNDELYWNGEPTSGIVTGEAGELAVFADSGRKIEPVSGNATSPPLSVPVPLTAPAYHTHLS